MPKISIYTDQNVFEIDEMSRPCVIVATKDLKQPNGISMNDDGKLVVTKGEDGESGEGGTMNTTGNGIHGNVDESLKVIRCNHTVSRLKLVASEEEGLLMSTIISNILAN